MNGPGATAHDAGPTPMGIALVVFYLLGIYTHITLFVTPAIPWPAAAAGIAGTLLLVKNLGDIRQQHIAPMFFLLLIGFLSVLFSPEFNALLGERLKSLLLLTYSLAVSYGLYLELVRWRRGDVVRLFLAASVLVVIGCALEVFTPLRSLSDGFRAAVFPEEFLYVANLRDQALFGMIRPKLFTAEPSFVAIFFVLTSTVWLVLTTSRLRFVRYFLLLGAALFLIRSPVLLLGAVTGGAAGIALAPARLRTHRMAPVNRMFLVVLALILSAAFVYVALATIMSERLDVIVSGRDDSFTIRITAPLQIALETIARYPLFGAGIGGREAILDIVLQTYLPVIAGLDYMYNRLSVGITNVFWLHWIFFGLVGGIAALTAIVKLIRSLGAGSLVFPAIVLLGFSHTMGAYVGPRYWTIAFVVLAATRLAKQVSEATQPELQTGPDTDIATLRLAALRGSSQA